MQALISSELTPNSGILERLDPRLRIVLVFLQALLITSINDLWVLGLLTFLSIILCFISEIKLFVLGKRLIAMDGFLIVVLFTLPFTTPPNNAHDIAATFHLGQLPLTASSSGLVLALSIFLKANAILLFMQALMGIMTVAQLCQSAALLKMPKKMVFLMAFTLRYLSLIHQQYQRMRVAMKLRAFTLKANTHGLQTMGYLIGMLLIRSLERSERIHQAMRCRGFVDQLYLLPDLTWKRMDSIVMSVVIGLQVTLFMIVQYGWI